MTSADPRKDITRRLRALKRRHDRVTASLHAVEEQRAVLYLEARDLGLTFKAIADIFGITEAAVMQKITRYQANRN